MSLWREIFSWELAPVSNPLAWKSIFQQRLRALAFPIWRKLEELDEDGYNRYDLDSVLNTSGWVQLMNTLLQGVTLEAWPENSEKDWINNKVKYFIPHIQLELFWADEENKGKRWANLTFDNEDHTVWVIETGKGTGRYRDYDIGGS